MFKCFNQVQQQLFYEAMQKKQGLTEEKHKLIKSNTTFKSKQPLSDLNQQFPRVNSIQHRNKEDCVQKTSTKTHQQPKQGYDHNIWTLEDQKRLQELHNSMGNKWVEIGMLLHKTENQVKNHYHSKLRKTLRMINRFIYIHLKKDYKPFKMTMISKIIQMAQQLFMQPTENHEQKFKTAYQLKNKILEASDFLQKQVMKPQERNLVIELIHSLAKFNRNKKKPKRFLRNNHLNLKKTKTNTKHQQQLQQDLIKSEENQSSQKKQSNVDNPLTNNLNNLAEHPKYLYQQPNMQLYATNINYNLFTEYFTNPLMYTYLLPPPFQMYSCQYNLIPVINEVVKEEEKLQSYQRD